MAKRSTRQRLLERLVTAENKQTQTQEILRDLATALEGRYTEVDTLLHHIHELCQVTKRSLRLVKDWL